MGLRRDPTFWAVVLFGIGGTLAEACRDVAVELAPAGPEVAEGRPIRCGWGRRGRGRWMRCRCPGRLDWRPGLEGWPPGPVGWTLGSGVVSWGLGLEGWAPRPVT
ncbi:acetate--CoA ligase family protein [Crossiella sp. NPDC003009]